METDALELPACVPSGGPLLIALIGLSLAPRPPLDGHAVHDTLICIDSALSLQSDLPIGRVLIRAVYYSGLTQAECGGGLDGYAIGLFDGAQAGGYPRLAGGDGLAVAPAAGALGQALAELLYLADVGFSLVGVHEDGGIGGGGIQDDPNGLALGGLGRPGR